MKLSFGLISLLLFFSLAAQAKIVVKKVGRSQLLLKYSGSDIQQRGMRLSPVEDDSCELRVVKISRKKRIAKAKITSCDNRDALFKGVQLVPGVPKKAATRSASTSNKKINWFAQLSYSLASTGVISESQFEAEFSSSGALNLGGGMFYSVNPKIALGLGLSYEMARALDKLKITKSEVGGSYVVGEYDSDGSISLINLEVDVTYQFDKAYALFGIVYPVSVSSASFASGEEMAGELGFSFGGAYKLSPKFAIEGQYRLLNLSFSTDAFSGGQTQFWGLMLRGRYFF